MKTFRAPRWLALLLVFGVVAASCGDDDDAEGDAAPTTAAEDDNGSAEDEPDEGAADDIDPEGTVRIGTAITDGTSNTVFDLNSLPSPASYPQMLIYDTLLRCQMDDSIEPGLASDYEVVDANTVAVELHEGVVFSDGTPMDAQAVADSILSHRDADNPGAFAGELQSVGSIDVSGPTSLTINLSDPIAGVFVPLLCRGETMPFSQADGIDHNQNPIGAGPYLLESVALQDSIVMTKNPDYFEADSIRIPTVEFVHIDDQDPQALVNALRSGTIDTAATASQEQLASLEGAGLEIEISPSPNTLFWGQTCKSREPLDDVRVRQALNHAIDRDRLNEVIMGGMSEPQWGFWPEGHPFHDPDLTGFFEYDLDRARTLLDEAGWADGFTVELAVTPGPSQTASEIIQADWAELGVDVQLVQVGNLVQEFFIENRQDAYFFPLQRGGLDKVTRNLSTDSIGNICNWQDPDLNGVIDQLRAAPQSADNPETVELWHELDRIVLEGAMNMFGVFGLETRIWNPDRLADVEFVPNFQGNPQLDVMDAYVKE